MVGKTVSHYKIESELGQGGMGVVYKAHDTMLGRTVALKFLPPMFSSDESSKARFVHEARAVSALDHPNIAVVHEIGGTDDDHLFIVMAFYEGQTLEDIIKEGPVGLDDAVSYLLDMAKGLAAAHDKGIIHRDIKPGNVMVTTSGFLKILDFGLAKISDVTMTMGAMSLGTLAYMSPEQAQGAPVDNRTDLWALGVVMYEMLAGKRPFEGPYDAAILYAAANTEHEPVSVWREDAPEHLASIVDKLLQKMPENRYQDAHELIKDIEAMRAPTPSIMAPVQPPAPAPEQPAAQDPMQSGMMQPGMMHPGMQSGMMYPPNMQSGMHPGMMQSGMYSGMYPGMVPPTPFWKKPIVVAGIVVIGLLGAGGSYYLATGGSSSQTEGTAVIQPREIARGYFDNAREKLAAGDLQMGLRDMERAKDADPTYAAAWASLAALYFQTGDYTRSVSSAREAITLDPEGAGPAYFNMGMSLAEQGRLDDAIGALESAINADSLWGAPYSALGDILIESGRPEEALEQLRKGSAVAKSEVLPFIYKNQGKALLAMGQAEQAIQPLRGSLGLKPDLAEAVLLLARSYDAIGQRRLAREQWELFLQLERQDLDAISEAEARLKQNP